MLVEPVDMTLAKFARKRKWKPCYATLKLKGYKIEGLRDIVEIDTLTVRLLPDEVRYQFIARDVVIKFDVLRAYNSKTIQIDVGSKFKKHF